MVLVFFVVTNNGKHFYKLSDIGNMVVQNSRCLNNIINFISIDSNHK
jgi:predicted transcriptional regulator